MGEVNDMKKVISVVMCAVMLLCCACFAGCSSQSEKSSKTYSQSPEYLAHYDFYFTGRFADWEYYNMDIAMGAAMDMVSKYKL